MARETRSPARMACEGPSPTMKGGRYFHRSAGACPPRALGCADASDGEGNPLACAYGMRGPKPYDEEEGLSAALLHRDQEVSPTERHRLHQDREGFPTQIYETPQLNPSGIKNKNLTFFVKCGKINYGFVR